MTYTNRFIFDTKLHNADHAHTVSQFGRDHPNKGIRPSGFPKYYQKWPTSVFLAYCGQTTVASPVCCCVWMRSLAVSNLRIRRAHCKLGYRAPERIYQAIELVRNRITPLGGRTLAQFSRLHSNIRCTLLYGRFGQIDYHYKIQDSAKIVCSVYKIYINLYSPEIR